MRSGWRSKGGKGKFENKYYIVNRNVAKLTLWSQDSYPSSNLEPLNSENFRFAILNNEFSDEIMPQNTFAMRHQTISL